MEEETYVSVPVQEYIKFKTLEIENEKYKKMLEFRVDYCNKLEKQLIITDKNYIPKSKVKEKIEEIKKIEYNLAFIISGKELKQEKIEPLEELLEEE